MPDFSQAELADCLRHHAACNGHGSRILFFGDSVLRGLWEDLLWSEDDAEKDGESWSARHEQTQWTGITVLSSRHEVAMPIQRVNVGHHHIHNTFLHRQVLVDEREGVNHTFGELRVNGTLHTSTKAERLSADP